MWRDKHKPPTASRALKVEHGHVHEGGQAIVGKVETGGGGDREAVPERGNEKRWMPDAWWKGDARAKEQPE